MVTHAFSPNTQEGEAGGSVWIWDQPCLETELQNSQSCYRDNLSCIKKKRKKIQEAEFSIYKYFWKYI